MKKLVVIPTDPIRAYEAKGTERLVSVFNPASFFDEVYIVSPFDEPTRELHSLKIISVRPENYSNVIKEIQPDIIRAYGSFFTTDLACYKRQPNIPLIVSVHDVVNISPSLLYADMVICMTQIVGDKVAELGVPKNKIRIMPNRVDTNLFYPCKASVSSIRNKFPEGKMILCVGRLTKQKNIDTLIKALNRLPEKYFCVFVGRGDSSGYLNLAQEQKVSERCFWIDSIRNDELPCWYNACDCFCTPSRWEGFGIVFIEAAACGTPIVTSNIAPMNEFLHNNIDSILVDEYENPEKISDAIIKLCENKLLAEHLSEAARIMSMNFDKKKVDLMEVEIYSEVLNNSALLTKSSYVYGDKEQIVNQFFNQKGKAVIFSAGDRGQAIFRHLNRLGIETAFFIDNDTSKQGNTISGKKIYPPTLLKEKASEIGAIIIPNYYWLEMVEQLNEFGNYPVLDYNYLQISHPINVWDEQYIKAWELLKNPGLMVDLGCGARPHSKATVAVDKFIEPEQRAFGKGMVIDVAAFEKKGIRFVNSDISETPFADKEFDTAYCHHVIEYVDDPIKACREIQRIAKKGVFFAPSAFAEIAFGRPYHKWLMAAKGNTLIFIEKSSKECQPFGATISNNPFEIALNYRDWYKEQIQIPYLRERLQEYWYGHHPVIEVVFTWDNKFDILVISNNGDVKQG